MSEIPDNRAVRPRTTVLSCAGTAAAAVTGWVIHDAAIFGMSAEPGLFWKLLPTSLILIAVGALLGALSGTVRGTTIVLLSIAVAGILGFRILEPSINRVFFVIPKALFLLTAASAVAALAHRRWNWTHQALSAFALGGFGASLLFLNRVSKAKLADGGSWARTAMIMLAVSLVLFLIGRVSRASIRRLLYAAVVLGAALPLGLQVRDTLTPPAPWRPDQRAEAPAGAPNLVMIVLDTVAAKHLAPYGYPRVTTPELDAFVADRAIRFTSARSITSWTLPTHGSLFTGLMPSEHGSTHQRVALPDDHPMADFPALPLRRDVPTLAGILTEQGWKTGAVIGNSPFVSRKFGMDRGFESFDDRDGAFLLPRFSLAQLFGVHPGVGHMAYRRAETITDLGLDWIARQDKARPFFLFLNYMDAHYPYVAPAPFDTEFVDPLNPDPPFLRRDPLRFDDPQRFSLLYDRELRYLDHHLGRLLEELKKTGALDSTVVMITSDHGEIFGEHGLWFHNLTLYENVVRVPLYLALPDGTAGEDRRPIQSADIFHLALRSVGLASEPRPRERVWTGEWYREDDLLKKLDDPSPLQRDLLAWLEGETKTIVGSNGKVERYDLAQDPWEEHDLAADLPPEQVQAARQTAAEWWEAHPPLAADAIGPLDPETLERLKALGYVD